MSSFIITSLIASVVLTIVINAVPRLFPASTERVERRLHEQMERGRNGSEFRAGEQRSDRRIQVFFPWKSMIVVSIVLTVVLNLIAYLAG